MDSVNLWAVVVAAVAYFVIGFLFHGPLFGKLWMKLAGITPTGKEKFSDMYGKMFWNMLANLFTAYILGAMVAYNGLDSAVQGMWLAFFIWLGFIVTGSSMEVIWMGRSFKHWLFEIGTSLVCFMVMGAILATW